MKAQFLILLFALVVLLEGTPTDSTDDSEVIPEDVALAGFFKGHTTVSCVFLSQKKVVGRRLPCDPSAEPQPECQPSFVACFSPELFTELAGEQAVTAGNTMRSLAGLAIIVAAASVYLYLLSTHLPPGPKQLQPESEGEDEGVQEFR
ncbi:transmembrane protein 41A-B-like protein [Lates japonicus]|uniref:Transmembrane protein 41A-B-like protein n=1 Tax=Lates japonicus TaxID=270547 RepID=A0AAD3NDK4_LATJO|nr:transmembrane protein 41A-B-like protein [Lates japonicus]